MDYLMKEIASMQEILKSLKAEVLELNMISYPIEQTDKGVANIQREIDEVKAAQVQIHAEVAALRGAIEVLHQTMQAAWIPATVMPAQ